MSSEGNTKGDIHKKRGSIAVSFFEYSFVACCILRGSYTEGVCDDSLSELTVRPYPFQEGKPFSIEAILHTGEEAVDSWEEIKEIEIKLPALLEEAKAYLTEHRNALETCIASGILYPYVDFAYNEAASVFIPSDFVQILADLHMGVRITQVGDPLKDQLRDAGLSDEE